jgi:hypothetical protein
MAGSHRGERGWGVVGLEADHRAGQGAGDTIHGLDAGDHQPAELVQAARLDSSDDVVGAGDVLGPLYAPKVADRTGDPEPPCRPRSG